MISDIQGQEPFKCFEVYNDSITIIHSEYRSNNMAQERTTPLHHVSAGLLQSLMLVLRLLALHFLNDACFILKNK